MAESDRFSALIEEAAALVRTTWIRRAEATLRGAERTRYIDGLQTPGSLTVAMGPSGFVFSINNLAPHAWIIEQGMRSFHLPSRIAWGTSPSVRRSRSGRYYLIIPCRHYSAQRGSRAAAGSPTAQRQMLPRAIYNVARQLRPGHYLTAGATQGRAVHAPGLRPYVPAFPPNVRPGYTHAAAQERLQRYPGSRRGAGTYLTFRTMTEDSPGWWIPARPARPIAAETVREVIPQLRTLLGAAATVGLSERIASQLPRQERLP